MPAPSPIDDLDTLNGGPGTVTTLSEMLRQVAHDHADRTAMIDGDRAVSYGSLETELSRLAAQLYGAGVRRGDGVALLLPNGLDFVTAFFSIVRLGAIPLPLNTQYQETEIRSIFNSSDVSRIVTAQDFVPLFERASLPACVRDKLFLVGNPPASPASTTESLDDLKVEIHPDSPSTYQFSSGSTGVPKRISRSHRNLLFEVKSLNETLGITNEDRVVGVAPFSHVNGLMRSMMTSLAAGATLYPLARFDRQALADLIEKHRISVFIGVPFMFGILAKTRFRRRPDFSSLRLCVSASAPMPAKLNREFHDKFGIYVRQLYGSTETGTISVHSGANLENTLESVGQPMAGIEVAIFAEDGQPVPTNEIGEIGVNSPGAMKAYDGCDELNETSFRDGHFLTGDLGRRDADGLLYLLGRKKFFINKGGYKINPSEVEQLLESHPKIDEAVVVGTVTPFGDERIKALVVLNGGCTEEEIIEHCRGKIADFKIPSLIEFIERIPKTSTGKIQRQMLI